MSAPGAQTVTGSPWAAHRPRAEALRERQPHAAEMLTLYLALLDAWEEAWRHARADPPDAPELAGWAAKRALPQVVAATSRAGPHPLAAAVNDLCANGAAERLLTGWLAGEELAPVERYLARAVLRGPLEAVDAAAVCAPDASPRGGRNCPACGGRPQFSYRTDADDRLVSGRRYLSCARCGTSWSFSGSTCASCGETSGAARTVFAEHRDGPVVGRRDTAVPADDGGKSEPPRFPHLRVEACETCSRYLIDIDLGLDARAIPEVDELTALPLDLFAAERGFAKIAPNLMGF
jgi:FdhE protein